MVISNYASELPSWTDKAGGKKRWADWLDKKAGDCRTRARKWNRARGLHLDAPSKSDWKARILKAIKNCGGRGHFSNLPLSLELAPIDARYPSVEHLVGPASIDVAIEIRVVNDMKTILSEREFRELLGHLACTMEVAPAKIGDDWKCERDFSGPEAAAEEPPL